MSGGYWSPYVLVLWAILLAVGYQRFTPEDQSDEPEAARCAAAADFPADHQLCGDDLEPADCSGDEDLEGSYLVSAVAKGARVTVEQIAERPRLRASGRGEIFVYKLTDDDALIATLLGARTRLRLCHPASPSAAAEDPRREGRCSAPLEIAAVHRAACGEAVEWIALYVPSDQQVAVGGFVAASNRYFTLESAPSR